MRETPQGETPAIATVAVPEKYVGTPHHSVAIPRHEETLAELRVRYRAPQTSLPYGLPHVEAHFILKDCAEKNTLMITLVIRVVY